MNIGFELDSIICTPIKQMTDISAISEQTVLEGAKEMLNEIKAQGHRVIVYTHRNVSTALETEAWLSKNRVPYDQIIFDRPRMMVMLFAEDCRQFKSWNGVKDELIKYGIMKDLEAEKKTIQASIQKPSSQGQEQKLK